MHTQGQWFTPTNYTPRTYYLVPSRHSVLRHDGGGGGTLSEDGD